MSLNAKQLSGKNHPNSTNRDVTTRHREDTRRSEHRQLADGIKTLLTAKDRRENRGPENQQIMDFLDQKRGDYRRMSNEDRKQVLSKIKELLQEAHKILKGET